MKLALASINLLLASSELTLACINHLLASSELGIASLKPTGTRLGL